MYKIKNCVCKKASFICLYKRDRENVVLNKMTSWNLYYHKMGLNRVFISIIYFRECRFYLTYSGEIFKKICKERYNFFMFYNF